MGLYAFIMKDDRGVDLAPTVRYTPTLRMRTGVGAGFVGRGLVQLARATVGLAALIGLLVIYAGIGQPASCPTASSTLGDPACPQMAFGTPSAPTPATDQRDVTKRAGYSRPGLARNGR